MNNDNASNDEPFTTDKNLCVCGHTLEENSGILTYYPVNRPTEEPIFGHLCPDCQGKLESLLGDIRTQQCDHCKTPLEEKRSFELRVHNKEGILVEIATVCVTCLREY